MTAAHRIETPDPFRYAARPLVEDGAAFVNATPQSFVVPCAGVQTAWVRILTATAGGTLAIRLRRTNGTEYPVAFGPADTTPVAGTAAETAVTVKGVKELVITFTPSGNGTFVYLDVGFEAP